MLRQLTYLDYCHLHFYRKFWFDSFILLFTVGHHVQDFEIRVGMSSEPPTNGISENDLCYYQEDPLVYGSTTNLTCGQPIEGRYVTIQLMFQDQLMLCEVEVYPLCK